MNENFAPSDRKYSDDRAEQAYCAYLERRVMKLGTALVGLLSGGRIRTLEDLQDFAWEQALDFVAPMEPEARDALIRDVPGLPWEDRNDPRLYWRLMYAAHMEMLADAHAPTADLRAWRRPLQPIISTVGVLLGQFRKEPGGSDPGFLPAMFLPGATPLGKALYRGVIAHAGDQIRIRCQIRRPVPLEPFARVRIGGTLAEVTGYGFAGTVTLSRETPPSVSGGLDWKLDPSNGRWTADAWPDRVDLAP